jgi:hypothetical protein
MPLQTTLTFDTPANFAFDSSLIDVSGGAARLKLQTTPTVPFSQDFASDVGFTYDAALAEFTGGLVRQKYLRLALAVLGATYTNSINASWGNGSLVGTPTGAPSVSGGKLLCLGGGNNGVTYSDATIGALAAKGAVKFKYTPNYSGAPSTNYAIWELRNPSSNNDRLLVFHSSTGTIRFTAYTASGTVIASALFLNASPWVPVSGTEYEFEFNFQAASGAFALYINGVLHGAVTTTTYTRAGSATQFIVGGGGTYLAADASFNDVVLFSDRQHTAGYTPGYSLFEADYLESAVTLPLYTYTGPGIGIALTAASSTETGAPRYTLNGQYYNGVSIVSSDGSYAQANTKAQIVALISALPGGIPISVNTLLIDVIFPTGNTQNDVSQIDFSINGHLYPTTNPTIKPNTTILMDAFLEFASTLSQTGSDEVRFQMEISGQSVYWNGSAWVNSDGSFAQSNTLAEVIANAATLPVTLGYPVRPIVVLHSLDGMTTPSITDITFQYDFFVSRPSDPPTCYVWLFAADIHGVDPAAGAVTLTVENPEAFAVGSRVIEKGKKAFVCDAQGRIEAELVQSVAANVPFNFQLSYTDALGKAQKIDFDPAVIPAQDSIALLTLTDISV